MKALVLCIAAVGTAAFGFSGAKWETWFPQDSARWNILALRESGLGRMASNRDLEGYAPSQPWTSVNVGCEGPQPSRSITA